MEVPQKPGASSEVASSVEPVVLNGSILDSELFGIHAFAIHESIQTAMSEFLSAMPTRGLATILRFDPHFSPTLVSLPLSDAGQTFVPMCQSIEQVLEITVSCTFLRRYVHPHHAIVKMSS